MDRLLLEQLVKMHQDFTEVGIDATLWRLGRWAKFTLLEEMKSISIGWVADAPLPPSLLGVPIEWVDDNDTIELLSPLSY